MAERSEATQTVRIRLISEAGPPKTHGNRPTEFGLKDKKRQLHRGVEPPDGTVQFDLDLQVRHAGPPGTFRFYGPFVLGPTDEQFIGLIWNYTDEPQTIRGQKIRLDTLTSKLIGQATPPRSGILQAIVVPVTERCATIPVEWIVGPESG